MVAIVWANSAAYQAYANFLHLSLFHHPLEFWINDGLMAIFFLLVGLELRREIAGGELSSPEKLAAPAVAAFGGMLVPAAIYSLFNFRDLDAMRGWAVPVATDIAFALAVLSVVGRRVPVTLKVFLTALAIFDDLGAIIVIALFYTSKIHFGALSAALALVIGLYGLSRLGVRAVWPYLVAGVVLWVLVERSGVHATLAGVALAMVMPAKGTEQRDSAAVRLEHALQPWVSYGILPLFGLANAGLRFDSLPPGAWRQPVALGTAAALVLGKQMGVFGAVMLAAKLKWAALPAGVTRMKLYGASVLCGIGFTMSLFINNLAFGSGSPMENEVKLAVFAGSVLSALLGLLVLGLTPREKLDAV